MSKTKEPAWPGLESDVPGHSATMVSSTGSYGGTATNVECQCGWVMEYVRARKDGRANAHAVKRWLGHLESAESPGAVINVGTIISPQRVKTLEVMPMDEALAQPSLKTPPTWWGRQSWGVVMTTRTKTGRFVGRKLVNGSRDQDSAVQYAKTLINRASLNGQQGDLKLESEIRFVTNQEAVLRVMNMVDGALDSENLHDIRAAWEEIEAFFRLTKLLEGKRDALNELRHNLLLGQAS